VVGVVVVGSPVGPVLSPVVAGPSLRLKAGLGVQATPTIAVASSRGIRIAMIYLDTERMLR
jgi:hypothetical protein